MYLKRRSRREVNDYMKRNAKVRIIALAALVVMAFAAALASFSFANRDDLNEDSETLLAEASVSKSIIDYIVLNSVSTDPGIDTMYHIVELGSSDTPSTLKQMAENENFKEYVFNGNKSENILEMMADGKVDYTYYKASSITNEDEAKLATIAKADFIYISNDPSSKYGKGNDFCEELYNLLHEHTTASYKPLVIDSPTKTTGGTVSGDKTGKELVSKYLAKTGALYYTYGLTTSTSVDDFFSGDISKSLYIGINGRTARTGWTTVYADDDTTTEKKMAKMLVISADGTGDALAQHAMTGRTVPAKLSVAGPADADDNPTFVEIPLTGADAREIYDISATKLYSNGYNARYAYRPEYMEVEKMSIADVVATTDLDSYDFIVIEASITNTVPAAAYNRLVSAMYGNAHILFDSSIATAESSQGTTSGNITNFQDTNYTELFYTIATEKEIARYANVMITTRGQFEIITSSESSSTAKIIADLINASSWRGIGGPGSTSTNFTVLELQPCYPIEKTIEEKKKTYYTKPSDVLDGKTAEQLGYELNPDSPNYKTWYNTETGKWGDSDIEYYAWELTPAKVADALDIKASDVTVVHMSTEAFECNKEDVLGKYDMIYIGGDSSAFVTIPNRLSINRAIEGTSTGESALKNAVPSEAGQAKYPTYTMYFHNGEIAHLSFGFLSYTAFKMSGTPLFKAANDANGTKSFITYSGNDLSYNNYLALKEYVDAGMPIMFSSVASAGYDIAKASKYEQNSIDPDSNMFKLMDYCKTKSQASSAIAFGINAADIQFVDNAGGDLGETLTGTVAVFNTTTADTIKSCFAAGTKRPKVAVTAMPAQYSQYDASTRLTSKTLSYAYDITGASSYTVNLYIDDDGNGKFDPVNEKMASSSTSKLEYSLGSFKGGPVSWKLEVVAKGTNNLTTKSTANGICYIRPTDEKKQKARVLQIYGADNPSNGMKGAGAQGTMSLMFCTECQKGRHVFKYNPTMNASYRDEDQLFYSGDNYHENLMNETWKDVYMGRHQHTFGIVRYDSNYTIHAPGDVYSTEGRDDWDYNFADELGDDFEFEIDIMNNLEFDEMSADITSHKAKIKYIPAEEGKENSLLVITDMSDELYAALPDELKARVVKEAVVPAARKNTMKTGFENLTDEEQADYEKLEQMVADAFLVLKNQVQADEVDTAETELRTFITDKLIPSAQDQYEKKEYSRLLTTKWYHDYYQIYQPGTFNGKRSVEPYKTIVPQYNTLYSTYARAMDKKLGYEEAYKRFNRYAASYSKNWIEENWDSIIIGPQENFNCQDINDAAGLAELKEFVLNDGQVLIFHEGLSRFSDSGASKLTATLLECFGNDPNHMEYDTSIISDEGKDVTSKRPWSGNNMNLNKLVIKIPGGGTVTANNNLYQDLMTPNSSAVTVTVNLNNEKTQINNVTMNRTDASAAVGTMDVPVTFKIMSNGAEVQNCDISFSTHSYYWGEFDATADYTGVSGTAIPVANYEVVTSKYYPSDLKYLPYAAKSGYSSDKYFLTSLSYVEGDDKYVSWVEDYKSVFAQFHSGRVGRSYSLNPYSSTQFMTDTANNSITNPYKYSTLNWSTATKWANDQSVKVGTNKALQNNVGIVTTYPFTLANELNVTGTHPSAYAVDVEDDDLTVWYSMAGGTYKERNMSDHYAATPLDGKDNYFIYSYGNVYYCGAGHTCVTGKGKDNNDERRLYINIICNSVRNTVAGPSIDVFDYGTTDNDKIVKTDDGYIYEIPDDLEYPDFTYRATVDKDAAVSKVNIYYKLDTESGSLAFKTKLNSATNKIEDVDRWIAKLPNDSVKLADIGSGKLVDIGVVRDSSGNVIVNNAFNKLFKIDNRDDKTDLFAPYGGNFTYIVIEVIDNKGNVSYQKIKIVRKGHLFDLT